MKLNSKIMLLIGLITGIFIGSNNFAISSIAQPKIAVVDVPVIIAKSAQVNTLKNEQAKKQKELAKWIEVVNADVKKQSTEANKQKLAKKYNEELTKKKNIIQQEYSRKLAQIDANISATIAQQAKIKGYNIVLTKSSVLYGGDDITMEISNVVK